MSTVDRPSERAAEAGSEAASPHPSIAVLAHWLLKVFYGRIEVEGLELVPRRTFAYDTLVIAVGSVANDFGVTGVAEHCVYLDDHR